MWPLTLRHYFSSGEFFMEPGVSDPVPTLNAPTIPYQLPQRFWGGTQAVVAPKGAPGEPLEMSGTEGLAVMGAGGH